ncbi:hypothetical protein [Paenibacillus sp. MMS18-CY102]|uniref:hypothetical protein n=1 Tax=Paenibacillus sp. MMS18-CY102 TaxID=2682849 RepID=UPI0013657881|nr:hypothetical protein [Paenibacillus sp. MMS18-CY102]MWC31095.1 hypothetical protein [Paenibacillus sp. MMS18-CY102]
MDGKEIVNIELECADLCKKLKTPPFSTKILNHENIEELKTFEQAIKKTKKMKGKLDYGVMFFMYLTYEDNTQKKYTLNVEDEDGRTALLVDTSASGQGYIIPEEQTNEIRKIIYSK